MNRALSILLCCCSLLPLPLGRGYLYAESSPSIVLLASDATHACGTGALLSSGEILTSLHLTSALCPQDSCSGVRVFRPGSPLAEVLPQVRLAITRRSPARDVALLSGFPEPGNLHLANPGATMPSHATLASFPHCRTLELSQGEITPRTSLHLFSTSQGAQGSSGAPLITPEGEIVAVVDEAATITSALGALLTGGTFPVRAARIDSDFLSPRSELDIFRDELTAVETLIPEPGFGVARVRSSSDFIVAVRQLKAPVALLDEDLRLRFELLKLQKSLEEDRDSPLSPPPAGPEWFQKRWAEAIRRAHDDIFPGAERYVSWLLIRATLACIVLILFGIFIRRCLRSP